MREALTGQLRVALANAQAAARRLDQDFVGSEHLLLGILTTDSCEAVEAMRKHEINLAELRQALEAALPSGEEDPVVTGNLPLSPKAQRAFNGALVKAQTLHEPSVSTRLLLLSLLDEPETAIRDGLRTCGADLDQLVRLLGEKPPRAEE